MSEPSRQAAVRQPAAAVLSARGLTKRFGSRQALRDVDVTLSGGERVAVIGPNGAGKTTLLSILAGIQAPSAGELNCPAGDVGWVPQQAAVYSKLTVAENLRLFARLEKVPDPDAAVARLLAQADLVDRADDELGRLSGGNRQRVNVAIGLLAEPPVLVLDEPSAALDPRQRARLWEFVDDLVQAGTSVMFSTHDAGEAERYGDRLLVLADGELLFTGRAPELRAAAGDGGGGDFEAAFVAFLRARGH